MFSRVNRLNLERGTLYQHRTLCGYVGTSRRCYDTANPRREKGAERPHTGRTKHKKLIGYGSARLKIYQSGAGWPDCLQKTATTGAGYGRIESPKRNTQEVELTVCTLGYKAKTTSKREHEHSQKCASPYECMCQNIFHTNMYYMSTVNVTGWSLTPFVFEMYIYIG